MSDTPSHPVNPETPDYPEGAVCTAGCGHRHSGMWRAVLYTPVVLILGGLAALATFPELAEYATPLVGDQASCSSQNGCPIAACANALSSAMGYSAQSAASSAPSCCSAKRAAFSCCVDSAEAPATSESAEVISGPLTSTDDGAADATAAVNAVATLEPENTLSN